MQAQYFDQVYALQAGRQASGQSPGGRRWAETEAVGGVRATRGAGLRMTSAAVPGDPIQAREFGSHARARQILVYWVELSF